MQTVPRDCTGSSARSAAVLVATAAVTGSRGGVCTDVDRDGRETTASNVTSLVSLGSLLLSPLPMDCLQGMLVSDVTKLTEMERESSM